MSASGKRPRRARPAGPPGQELPSAGTGELIPEPRELVPRNGTPDTISGWKAVADGFLSDPCCAFHRNVEISSRYAWMYRLMPAASSGPGWRRSRPTTSGSPSFRSGWTPIALATWTSRTAWFARRLLLMEDVNTIRATNNAIFDDIFWVHFAYVRADDGIERLRALLRAGAPLCARPVRLRGDRPGTPCLGGRDGVRGGSTGPPKISFGRATSSSSSTSSAPWCNRTSIASRAPSPGSISIGSATTFEVRGIRRDVAYFTSFYLSSLPRAVPHGLRRRGRGSPASTTAGAGS